jgi:hypothetical protein
MRSLLRLSLLSIGLSLALATGAEWSTWLFPTAHADSAAPDPPAYQLSAAEQKLNCKQISGRMQVRILQFRDYNAQTNSSQFSRGLQSIFSSTVGTSSKGLDPNGTHADDLRMLTAYNQMLVDKGCKSFDLQSQLQQKDPNSMPAATVPAPKKTKAPQQ